MESVLKRSEERMKKEMGDRFPETIKQAPENLGSCITGEWRQFDDEKDN